MAECLRLLRDALLDYLIAERFTKDDELWEQVRQTLVYIQKELTCQISRPRPNSRLS